jgi:two-component sensor histidine kinase
MIVSLWSETGAAAADDITGLCGDARLNYAATVVLDRYLIDLCQAISTATSGSDQAWSLIVKADPLVISTDIAVPLGLIVNELVTNAIQHSRPMGEGGSVHIVLKSRREQCTANAHFSFWWLGLLRTVRRCGRKASSV